jgi:hypothetical protein
LKQATAFFCSNAEKLTPKNRFEKTGRNMNKDKNTLKELIMVLKNDYKTPGKFLIWGMVAGQWFAILFILFVFLHNFGYFPSMLESKFYSALQKEDAE